jgi:hypothetical protein
VVNNDGFVIRFVREGLHNHDHLNGLEQEGKLNAGPEIERSAVARFTGLLNSRFNNQSGSTMSPPGRGRWSE